MKKTIDYSELKDKIRAEKPERVWADTWDGWDYDECARQVGGHGATVYEYGDLIVAVNWYAGWDEDDKAGTIRLDLINDCPHPVVEVYDSDLDTPFTVVHQDWDNEQATYNELRDLVDLLPDWRPAAMRKVDKAVYY